MESIEAILTRRSTRKFSTELPERGLIEKILEAGRYAPMHFPPWNTRKIPTARLKIPSMPRSGGTIFFTITPRC